MSITKDPRYQVYEALMDIARKGDKLEFALRLRCETEHADRVRAANVKVYRKIDDVLDALMRKWSKDIQPLLKQMKATNAKLQRAYASLQRTALVGRQVARALTHLDEAVTVAARILRPLA